MIFFYIGFIAFCSFFGWLFRESAPWNSGWIFGIGFCSLINMISYLAR